VSKTIVITGAGIGLGRALARRFAGEGHQVVLLGRTVAKVEAAAAEIGANALAIECDVSQPDSVRAAFAVIAERHPKIDVLINNAAVYEPSLVRNSTDEQILGPILTNLAGGIYTCRSAIPMMERGGLIINISSESVGLPFAMMSLYQASKAGLERFTESLRKELEPDGIRVTLVRAGSMFEEGKTFNLDPDIAMQFAMGCAKNGLNLRERPIAHFTSVTNVFGALIALPADVQMTTILLEAAAA
jgi:meso-butanediol dehydrogenase / (S,S)-butanediol dehydrogenase / diacetyl reductase